MQTSPRLISMYLPQYHQTPENDRWWGEGFTEWARVRAGTPRFHGHYQPHVPGQLGYYDLRDAKVRSAQAELAREHGIHGFCYYHYWFNGRRLLELPFEEVLKTGEPDFPFCLCWANENWTRRWDGQSQKVLIEQKYSDEDSLNFIRSLIPAFQDRRYIRVDGRPLLLVYRTGLLPNPGKVAEIWRKAMKEEGVGDLYLVRIENFMHGPEPAPGDVGFDAAMEFAPYWGFVGRRLERAEVDLPTDIRAYSYDDCMKAMLNRPLPSYKLFRGIFTGWDNSPRRNNGPTIFIDSSPEKYAYWLSLILKQTVNMFEGDDRIVFINAWNEWGEGCHLEPDEKYGLRYLRATRMVFRQSEDYALLIDKIRHLRDADEGALQTWLENLDRVYSSGDRLTEKEAILLRAFGNLTNPPKMMVLDSELNDQVDQLLRGKDAIIQSIFDSLSWKITAPLRKLYDKFFT
ncbi:MAG: glycoside hydrolase family 99-like domain-containing protein [Syntrophaceae bacterium]|nr:glycoside hydrolase family 99-like domain-containing protein [Syntrophaceae bacterium]